MPLIITSPLSSEYGFKSNGFTVDEEGNIVAKSITLSTNDDTVTTPADFTITQTGNDLVFASVGTNPDITVIRSEQFIFDITLSSLNFTIYAEDQTSLYSTGLRHSDGTSGVNAQSKSSGRLVFTVPVNAPATLYYGSSTNSLILGSITIVDPIGVFSTVAINSTIDSSSVATGALVVAGGVGVAGALTIGTQITSPEINTDSITSSDILVLDAENNITVNNAGIMVGQITEDGSSIPVINTTVDNSSINGTSIGDVLPSTASFTTATVTTVSGTTSVTNKTYVDSTAIALSIAFGI